MEKTYLGDSVYAEFDGNGVTLMTENGRGASNTIYMELEVIQSLIEFVKRMEGTA